MDPAKPNIQSQSDPPSLCLVTHPLSTAGEPAAHNLLEILREVTASLKMVTARLPADSGIRDEFELVEVDAGQELGDRTILSDAFWFVRNQIRMSIEVARSDADVVLFFGAISYLLPILVARLTASRTILEPRGDVPLTLRIVWGERIPQPLARALAGTVWALERIGYTLATDIVLYTPSMQSQLGLERFDDKTNLQGARYVDTDLFHPGGQFTDREVRVGYLGRLDEEKGIREITDAAASLAEQGIAFTFVGDGELADYIEERLADHIRAGEVELLGWVDHEEVPEQLRRFRLLVMASSPTEGLPMTALEAMACGTPVCAPPVAGLQDVVVEGETGVHIETLTSDAIATRAKTAMEQENLSAMSRRCVELINDQFSFKAAVERYAQILS